MSRLDQANVRVASGMSERLVDQLARSRHRTARSSLTRLAVVALATPVHLVTLGIAATGVVLLWPGTTLWQKFLGVLCLALAYALRPTFGRFEKGPGLMDPAACPETVALVREVAGAVHSPLPTRLEVSTAVNAFAGVAGLRGRVVSLGAPLWVALSGPERVALLGHELGHLAHGDALQGRYVWGAYQTLQHWEEMLSPASARYRFRPMDQLITTESAAGLSAGNSLLAELTSVLLWPVRATVVGYRRLVELVAAPSSRRQEHYADLASARAAGTAAAAAMLEVLLADAAIDTAANRAAITRADLADAITERMAAFDAGQRRTLRHGSGAEASRIDDSHPPTLQRLRLVESAERVEPAVVVSPARWAAIDAELSATVSNQLKRLADDYRYAH